VDEQLIHTDRKLRRVVLLALVAFAGIGAALVRWVLPWATRYVTNLEPAKALRILQIALSAIFLSVLPIAWYIAAFGRKVVTSRRMPPPGTKVIKDTAIITGQPALARGKALVAIAALLAILSLIGGLWLPWKMGKVMSRPCKPQPVAERATPQPPTME
jgi:hypothetical protein